MDTKIKKQMLKQLDNGIKLAVGKRESATRDIAELTRLREALTQVGEHSPENPNAKNGSAPLSRGLTTTPLIAAILCEDKKREWTIPDMTDEMRKRGWQSNADDPARAVASTFSTLVRDKYAARPARGTYRANAKTAQLIED